MAQDLGLRDNGGGRYCRKAFLYGIGLSLLFFVPFILFDKGYFLFYGDYNVQQVPFYQMCHDAVRSGNWGWSWSTDLGANFIGSYSFYLLGSPFFWLTIPFPSWMVPHLMGPLLILKFGCATLTSFIYLRRYVRHPDYAIVGALLYAFSGFSVYNIFFNHFHEAIVFFPLMLWAMDEYMYHRRRGVFALTVFLCCTINYYFFAGQVVFLILYWSVRMLSGSWSISVRDFLLLFCEAVIGVLCSCILLIPTVLAVIQNPRVNDPPNGWSALLYDYNQRYLHILECFFFPPDIPARPNFTPNSEAKWASLGAWFPLFSMSGVIAFLQSRKKHWLKTLLFVLFLMALVPILNAAFQAVQHGLLRALVLYADTDDGAGNCFGPPGAGCRLAQCHSLDPRHHACHRAAHRPYAENCRQQQREKHRIRAGRLSDALLGLCGHCAPQPCPSGHYLPVLPP